MAAFKGSLIGSPLVSVQSTSTEISFKKSGAGVYLSGEVHMFNLFKALVLMTSTKEDRKAFNKSL